MTLHKFCHFLTPSPLPLPLDYDVPYGQKMQL